MAAATTRAQPAALRRVDDRVVYDSINPATDRHPERLTGDRRRHFASDTVLQQPDRILDDACRDRLTPGVITTDR